MCMPKSTSIFIAVHGGSSVDFSVACRDVHLLGAFGSVCCAFLMGIKEEGKRNEKLEIFFSPFSNHLHASTVH